MRSQPIINVARKCAYAGMTLAQAKHYFTALYVGDALAMEFGNVGRAAERAGIERTTFNRAIGRAGKSTKEGDVT